MAQPQVVVDGLLAAMPFVQRSFWWQPFEKSQHDGAKGLIDTFHGRRSRERFAGFN